MGLRSIWLMIIAVAFLSGNENEYQIGHGIKINDTFTIGGYFSTEYEKSQEDQIFKVDDVAFLMYGSLTPSLSFMAELEATDFYTKNFDKDNEAFNYTFHIERLYLDYAYAEYLKIRVGKQITPIGYWNLEPINVLRDTTSNPLYAIQMFPRFLTGIDLSGYVMENDALTYHLFIQKNKDFDENYINIANEHFFGLSLEYEIDQQWNVGGSIGEFITLDNTHYNYLQFNTKYEEENYTLNAEAVLRHGNYEKDESKYSGAAYVEGVYHITDVHAVVSRYEYFKDIHLQEEDNIFLLGYSYRPIYPVSVKAEYQWHTQENKDCFLVSFSVLF